MTSTQMSKHWFGRTVIAGVVGLVGMSLGCGSPSGPSSSAAPSVSAVFPNTGPTGGAVEMRITGRGFQAGATVTLDDAAVNVTVVSSTVITATAPLHAAGTVDVVVTNVGGQSGRLTGAFTYVPVAITAVSPPGGLLTGEVVTVAGSGFLPGATVTMDGIAAAVRVVAPAAITVTAPAHAAGTVDVVVTNPSGQSGALTAGYTYGVIAVSASPSFVTSGSPLTMSWITTLGRGCIGDWVQLFKVGDPDSAANARDYGWSAHLCDVSGALTLSAPAQSGAYEFRYMIGDRSVASSNAVTVSAPASPSIPAVDAGER